MGAGYGRHSSWGEKPVGILQSPEIGCGDEKASWSQVTQDRICNLREHGKMVFLGLSNPQSLF